MESFGEELVQEGLFQLGGQRDQPLLLLHRPLNQPQHPRYPPLLVHFGMRDVSLLQQCEMTVVSPIRDVEAEKRVIEELGVEQFDYRLQDFRSVCTENERKVHVLEAARVIAKDDERQVVPDDLRFIIVIPGDERLPLIDYGKPP